MHILNMKEQEQKYSIIAEYYATHYQEVLGYVNKRLSFADEAEDIVQDVFLRLLKSKKMISEVTLPCLVYTIASNLIFDYWRHHGSQKEYEKHMVAKTDTTEDVATLYDAKETQELLEHSIARLDDRLQHIYRLNVYDNKKVAEISQLLGMNYKCVEKRLGLARKEVRIRMSRLLA